MKELLLEYRGMWQAVLGELEVSVSRASFATWFKNTAIIANEDGHVIVAVPNIFTKAWLEKNYAADIKKALSKINESIKSVEYRVTAAVVEGGRALGIKAVGGADVMGEVVTAAMLEPVVAASAFPATVNTNLARSGSLNPRYTFDNFVVGSSNELAFAAAQGVVRGPGDKYNPLFLYGGPGLGKTHLIQAVGNQLQKEDPDCKVEYVTSEDFTNEFLSSLARKKTSEFKDKYRKIDVLIVDDVQFLAGKERTVEEFFHIFNSLHQKGKQIILSSDRPPKAIATIEDRLRSRFEWGMTADIQPPDYETRAAILQSKAAAQGLSLPMEVVNYMAHNTGQNVRELEGALTQLVAHCEFRGLEPNLAAATGILGHIAAGKPKLKPLTAAILLEKTAKYYDLQTADLTGPKRDKAIVVPRQIAMYLMRHEMSLSFPKIAAVVGGRDHTTALHSVNKIEKLLESDENLRNEIDVIREQLALPN